MEPTLVKLDTFVTEADDYLTILDRAGAYYEAPRDETGRRIGPLVSYNETYKSKKDGSRRRFVGDIFYRLDIIAKRPSVREFLMKELEEEMRQQIGRVDNFVGVSATGQVWTDDLQRIHGYNERIEQGTKLVIVRDKIRDMDSITDSAMMAAQVGARVVGVVCLVNESVVEEFFLNDEPAIPIISLVHRPNQRYRWNDPEVDEDVAVGNVIWDPIANWPKLRRVMQKNRKKSSRLRSCSQNKG